VEISSTPWAASRCANSTNPVLSVTLRMARLTFAISFPRFKDEACRKSGRDGRTEIRLIAANVGCGERLAAVLTEWAHFRLPSGFQ
jgi:hypothetical protein